MNIYAIALQGLAQAESLANTAATNLADLGAQAQANPSAPVDTVDLSSQVVQLQSAENQVALNLSTLKTADQIEQKMIDLMA